MTETMLTCTLHRLIHSAAGGIGQACIKLALLIGAKVFVTVGTPAKVDFLMKTYALPRSHILNSRDLSFAPKIMALTEGKGVDVVINSLAGEALRETWNCIAMFGRFVELGKKDSIQNANLGMAPFERSASFIAVGFDLFGAYKSTVPGTALRQVMDLFSRGDITPITPITTYSIADIEKAFRLMQSGNHIGKIVINADHECSVPVSSSSIVHRQNANESVDCPKTTLRPHTSFRCILPHRRRTDGYWSGFREAYGVHLGCNALDSPFSVRFQGARSR